MIPRHSSFVLTDPSHVNSIYPFCTSMSLKEEGEGVFMGLINGKQKAVFRTAPATLALLINSLEIVIEI